MLKRYSRQRILKFKTKEGGNVNDRYNENKQNRFKTPILPTLIKLKIKINIIKNYFLKLLHHFLAAN